MQLDHVVPTLTQGPIVSEAMNRSVRWLERCAKAQKAPERCILFPIVQGGLDLQLREKCVQAMVPMARVGIAIGGKQWKDKHFIKIQIKGLSGGEAKDSFWRTVARCCELIPVFSFHFNSILLGPFGSLCDGRWLACGFGHFLRSWRRYV